MGYNLVVGATGIEHGVKPRILDWGKCQEIVTLAEKYHEGVPSTRQWGGGHPQKLIQRDPVVVVGVHRVKRRQGPPLLLPELRPSLTHRTSTRGRYPPIPCQPVSLHRPGALGSPQSDGQSRRTFFPLQSRNSSTIR